MAELTVLVVDDDLDLLEMVGYVLKYHKITTHTISNAELLMPSLKQVNPDLVLMDVFLNDADGRVLCRDLKNAEEHRDLPVILYSAGVLTPESIEESLADDFLKKPFENAELVTRIRSLVEK